MAARPWLRGGALFAAALVIAFFFAAGRGGAADAAPVPPPALDATPPPGAGDQVAVLSGGCFWGMQLVYEHVKGVTGVTAGYTGGAASTATYGQVETGTTGHAESVRISFDPSQITYGQILQIFFGVAHDPTELNRQGPDAGTQYRSMISFTTPEQERIARAYIEQLERAKVFSRPIVTEVVPFKGFYRAEPYHQDFAARHPEVLYIRVNDLPKVKRLQERFPQLYRADRLAYRQWRHHGRASGPLISDESIMVGGSIGSCAASYASMSVANASRRSPSGVPLRAPRRRSASARAAS